MNQADKWNSFADGGRAMLVSAAIIAPMWRKDFRSGFNALTATLAASATSKAIKGVWREPRPNGQNDHSFPSEHAADCFAAATILRRDSPNGFGPAAIGLAVAVCFARVFSGKHHVVDVVAGGALGILAGEMAADYRSPLPEP
jgi:membrane-associated phospholipid phosphatase